MSSYRYTYGADGTAHAQLQNQVAEIIMSHTVSVQILRPQVIQMKKRGGAQSEYSWGALVQSV